MFQSFLQGLLTKDPRQRLSWPKLLYHPFIKDLINCKYKLHIKVSFCEVNRNLFSITSTILDNQLHYILVDSIEQDMSKSKFFDDKHAVNAAREKKVRSHLYSFQYS